MPRTAWILCFLAMTTSASAQPAHAQAEALFRQGKELMKQQRYEEACAAFESSYRLEPSVSTLLNHANCREKNAQFATAWRLFVDAERQTRAKPDADSKQLNTVSASRVSALEARLSKLSIDVAPDHRLDDLEVLRDADRVDPDTWNRPLLVDGGTYKITARATGRAEWSTTVVIQPEGDVQTVAIPKLDPVMTMESHPDLPSPPTPATGTELTSTSPPSPDDHVATRSLAIPIAMGGAALVLGGTAFAFSRWGDSIYADAKREPEDATQEALWRSANKRRYAAIGLGAGAIGCAGAAIYLHLRGGRESAQPVARRSLRIEPTASASSMGLGVRGVW